MKKATLLLLSIMCCYTLCAGNWSTDYDAASRGDISIRFRSNSPTIVVKYLFECESCVEECDLFVIDNNGEHRHLSGEGGSVADTIVYSYTNIDYSHFAHKNSGHEFQLWVPATCNWVGIETAQGSHWSVANPREESPIVVCGAEECSVDRATDRWEVELSRLMDRPLRVINNIERVEAKVIILTDEADMSEAKRLYPTTPIVVRGGRTAVQLEVELRELLSCPKGDISTTIPVTQRRVKGWEWQEQCRCILRELKTTSAKSVVIGDSIVQNWGSDSPYDYRTKGAGGIESWRRYFSDFVNLGIGADRVENLLARVYNDEMEIKQFEKILVMIGTNNLNSKTSYEDIAKGVENLVEQIRVRQSKAKIYLMGILPRRDIAWSQLQLLNAEYEKVAQRQGVRYICVGHVLMDEDDKTIDSLYHDRVHLTPKGYMVLGEALEKVM